MGSAQAQPPPARGCLVSELGQPSREILQPSVELAAAASLNRGGSEGLPAAVEGMKIARVPRVSAG